MTTSSRNMLNIVSRSIVSKHTRGPRKVVTNLISGLKEINYPFTINADLGATKTLWIHDDPEALIAAMKLPHDVAVIAGPNIYTLPSEIPSTIDLSRVIWIHPAPWVEAFWRQSGADDMRSEVWPVGIDTSVFTPSQQEKDLVLVYNKQRTVNDVEAVCEALEARGEKYRVLTYGEYSEEDYLRLLGQSKAIVWVGRSESQGIGLLEALSMNVPALVWDVSVFGNWEGAGKERFSAEQLSFSPVTAAPYFDDTCGLKFTDRNDLRPTLDIFFENISTFTPRKYIEKELSLQKQATDFLNLFKSHFNINDTELRDTTLRSNKKWQNGTLWFKYRTRLKDAVRQLIR
jgi:hypothetical protein